MNKKNDFDSYLKEKLKNKNFKENFTNYDSQLKIAYQILQFRKKQKISQFNLAKSLKTNQSNIARMEAGKQNFSIKTLEKIAMILNCELKIDLIKK